MNLEFEFEKVPWEEALDAIEPGGSIHATYLLSLLESEDDEELEMALEILWKKEIALNISDLPKYTADTEGGARLAFEEKLAGSNGWMAQLENSDPLKLYLEEIAQIPVSGDPQLLAEDAAAGKEETINSLVNLMLYRVVDSAPRFTGMGVLLLDLIQEGSLGLWQGLQRYKAGNIEEYCDWWIRQFMAGAVTMQAKASGIGQKMRRAMEDYRDIDQKLLTELGRNPTLEEMAEALHMTAQQTAIVAETLENAQMLQRAKAPAESEQDAQEDELAVEDTAYFQMRQRIVELLSVLPEEDANLLTMRYGLEGGIPMKPQQVAIKLGITPEEVSAREAAALGKLRQENEI